MAQTKWVYSAKVSRRTVKSVVLVSDDELTESEAWRERDGSYAGDIDDDTVEFSVGRPLLVDCPPDRDEEEE